MTTQDPRTHWIMTYGLVNGRQVRTSTRGHMEPTTEEEAIQAVGEAVRQAMSVPGGILWLPDMERGGEPTLVMVSQLCQVDLERDVPEDWSPEDGTPERDRRPEPGNYGPGQPRLRAVQDQDLKDPRDHWPHY